MFAGERVPGHECRASRPGLVEPAELGVHIRGAVQHNEPLLRQPWTIREPRRRIADLLERTSELVDFDVLEVEEPVLRSCYLNPATVHPRDNPIQFTECVVAVLRLP